MMESPDDVDLALEEGDIGDIVIDDDETSLAQESIGVMEYNRWKDWIVQRKKKLLIYGGIASAVVLVAVVALVVILSVTLTGSDTSDWNNDYKPPAPGSDPDFDNEPLFWDDGTKYDDGKICLTAEFQLVLDPSKFAPRQKGIDEFAAYLESISTFLLPGDKADVNIREQYTVNVDNCVSHYQVRVRDYIDGPRNNTQTVDIKAGVVSSIAEGRNLPFAPADAYVHPSFQKIERDVHSCDGKFSRETRVASQYNKQYHTCGDLIKMFPGAFTAGKYDKMTPEQLADAEKRTVSANSGVYWYTNVSRGIIEGGTMEEGNGKFSRWKSDFTLRYSHLEDARKGISAPSAGSEWSLRVYGVNDGLGELDETVIQKISVWYKELVKKFGDYGATKECR